MKQVLKPVMNEAAHRLTPRVSLALLALALAALSLLAQSGRGAQDGMNTQIDPRLALHPVYIAPGPVRAAHLYADDRNIQVFTETVWRPMCGSEPGSMTIDDLQQHAEIMRQLFPEEDMPDFPGLRSSTGGGGGDGGIAGGFTINFVLDSSVPNQADSAFDAIKAYLESKFNDPITITINVSFDSLDSGILGQTGSHYTHVSWSTSRNGLQHGMDGNDNLQHYLPSTSTIPVRYDGSKTTITNETRVFWTFANFNATVGTLGGAAADMVFSSNINWDYDPSDGVTGYSFQDVLVHETGHVMGFTSGADYRVSDIEAMDIYRFQRTGGGHDYNPDTTAEFKVRPRLVSFNSPNDDVISDFISKEYRMSDGIPYQCSHWRLESPSIGAMAPALGSGETRWPGFYSGADLRMFDALGYDR